MLTFKGVLRVKRVKQDPCTPQHPSPLPTLQRVPPPCSFVLLSRLSQGVVGYSWFLSQCSACPSTSLPLLSLSLSAPSHCGSSLSSQFCLCVCVCVCRFILCTFCTACDVYLLYGLTWKNTFLFFFCLSSLILPTVFFVSIATYF